MRAEKLWEFFFANDLHGDYGGVHSSTRKTFEVASEPGEPI